MSAMRAVVLADHVPVDYFSDFITARRTVHDGNQKTEDPPDSGSGDDADGAEEASGEGSGF